MGLSESKPLQYSFRDILEKIRCYFACCGGQVIIEEHDESDHEDIDSENPESDSETDSETESVGSWV